MKKILLGVTKQGHRDRAELVTSSARRVSGSVWIILVLSIAGWAGHGLEFIPLIPWPRPEPPAQFLRSIGHVESPTFGTSGVMVDETHFLTTQGALNVRAKIGDSVSIRFQDDLGSLQDPVAGKVKWISEDKNGIRLALVQMAEARVDYATLSPEPFGEAERCAATGFAVDLEGETKLKTDFCRITAEGGFLQADWGNDEPPVYEGFPLTDTKDFFIKGLLSEGFDVVEVSVEELADAGLRF